jgi:protein phosphatase
MAGEEAARIVVEWLLPHLRDRLPATSALGSKASAEAVQTALVETNAEILRHHVNQQEGNQMGATVVSLIIRGKQALITHLGDSRAYLCRNRTLLRLTRDHTLATLLLDAGYLTADEAALHHTRNRLVRFMGSGETLQPDFRLLDLFPGDQLLLCSDGLNGMLGDDHILSILNQGLPPADGCQALITAANAAGGYDNITALLVTLPA